jgi:2'-5' RNA ligase superfamily
MSESAAPIIVSALIGEPDFTWLDGLRQQYFPPERNFLRAHLTLFHHLPPSVEQELCNLLADLSRAPTPKARVTGLINLGRGVALRIESPELHNMRDVIASRFAEQLTPQDKSPWRAHVTVQNKVAPDIGRALLRSLEATFEPRPLKIAGLAAWWYRGGPWEQIAAYKFR